VAKSLPQGKLILVDVQQEMLDMARQRLEQQGCANVEYLRADAVSLPLEDASVDVAFSVAVLGEVANYDAALRELRRVLRPRGTLSLTERMLGDPHSLKPADVLERAQAAGFSRPVRLGHVTQTVNLAA
jgi:ubiquinone/menaquinone biosynthesis C-methylase UbiE